MSVCSLRPVARLTFALQFCAGTLEVLGSGPGTMPLAEIFGAIPRFMALAAVGDLPIGIDEVPLADVEPAWRRTAGGHGRPADRHTALNTGRQSGRGCGTSAAIRHRSGRTHGALHDRTFAGCVKRYLQRRRE